MPHPFTAIFPADALDVSGLPLNICENLELWNATGAAFQQFIPGVDVGIDLSKEYAVVKSK